MKVIGLTGPSGSGKSAAAAYMSNYAVCRIDADEIAHEVILPKKPAYLELVDHFGARILDREGKIERKKLGEMVFSDEAALAFLNACTHRHIIREIERALLAARADKSFRAAILDAPLLIEAGLCRLCDEVWVVLAAEALRLKRVMARDAVTYEQAKNRAAAQLSEEEYRKHADVVIENNGSASALEQSIRELAEANHWEWR